MGIRVIAAVKEDLGEGEVIKDFRETAWPEAEVILDEKMIFWYSLYENRLSTLNLGKLACDLCCMCCRKGGRLMVNQDKKAKARGIKYKNADGEGKIMGGFVIIAQGGKITYAWRESDISEYPGVDELVEAARAVSRTAA